MATAFINVANATSVRCLNFRGCNDKLKQTTAGGYHVGFTDDLRTYVDILNEEEPDASIFLSGFSLGGNTALKFLGEESSDLSPVIGASVLSIPYNCTANQPRLDSSGFNRAVYSNNFLKTLKKKAIEQNDDGLLPPSVDFKRVMACTTIGEIDDSFISPIYGFKDRYDYYAKNSCCYFLEAIKVPVYIVSADDDPFFNSDYKANENDNELLVTNYQEHGGHCGFVWDETKGDQFGPIELARFARHIFEQ